MAPIRVVVHGALGKMGQTVLEGVAQESDMTPVGGVDVGASEATLGVAGLKGQIPLAAALTKLPESVKPDVLVDFSVAHASLPAVRWAAEHKVNFVVGTTGLSSDVVEEMGALAAKHGVGGMVAPNFALGAVLMMYLAKKAAPFFDYAEIIELHHETKIDAPSGTSAATARLISEARGQALKRNVPSVESVPGTRAGAVDGVTIHSVRLPGFLAHQEVIFGTAGQTMSIRHDTINRTCYLPGITIAIKHVAKNKGLVFGLDQLLGLKD